MIDKKVLLKIVKSALEEDIGKGDITTKFSVSPDINALGIIVAKEKGILAGTQVAKEVFWVVDKNTKSTFQKADGDKFISGEIIADIRGKAPSLLSAERVALNFLQRMSGIATLTARYVKKIKGTKAKILDTRKTTPNLRLLEKYAVRVSGGFNHRMGLYDQILIKDNHINLGNGIRNVLNKIKDVNSGRLFVEIEVKNIRQLRQALRFNVDRIMLDNMSIEEIGDAVKIVNGRCELEVSGNISLQNIREIAEAGVDYISVGSLTHSYNSIDLCMRIRRIG
ncbi:carboxylating nicotinate-nucleotide diphosphorylase [candidate division WOR-3 bacterium]|nr:carboxylating nicotinate-nucleotide diphosphorylase [candidate division WOR-3 bacterium]TET79379.1 MAG: carboxylating nicotinate-nucleotide diphosphorylase [Candidatus Cloacimonadota bacterium]